MSTSYDAYNQHNWRNFFGRTSLADVSVSDDEWDGILQKAQYDTGMATTVNKVFGAVLYAQYNDENQFYAAMPQVDRFNQNLNQDPKATAFRAAHSPVPLQTHSEGASIPSPENFSVEEFNVEVKRSETVLEVSDLQQIRSAIDDSVGLEEFMDEQMDQLNLAIDRDALAAPALEADSDYSAVDEITPLDRVIASSDEEGNVDDANGNAFTDGALDYGTIDRSTDTWADSYVDYNATDRSLTVDLMNSFIDGLTDFGSAMEENLVLLTGRDTATILSELQADNTSATNIYFDGTDFDREDINDAYTSMGLPGTTRFRHYRGIPIVPNQTVPSDSISRIYALDLSTINGQPKIAIENYAEPYTETAGRGQEQGYIAQGQYTEQALMLLNHEVVVRDFGAHGKLRDLQA
jgi:hypothetical protein